MTEGKRSAILNEHQIHQLIAFILKEYDSFGIVRKDGKVVLDRIENPSDLLFSGEKTVIPFKKILWPDNRPINSSNDSELQNPNSRKIAFLGLPACDATALSILLKEFNKTKLLPERSQILVVSARCEPDESCFCTAMPNSSFENADLHIQPEGNNFCIFPLTKNGQKLLDINEIKTKSGLRIKEITLDKEKIETRKLEKAIGEKEQFCDFWQKIADNCFGCGACSAVCPLCFCFRQSAVNEISGDSKQCLNWDSCFSKSFSEIQHHFDFRPENVNRLYNWYHHKFRRAPLQNNHILCTGCGRCIEACPAHLNQYGIINSIIKQDENIQDKIE